jgi:cobalamin biosynthesis protein CobT
MGNFSDVTHDGPSYAKSELQETDSDIKVPGELKQMKAEREFTSECSEECPTNVDLTKEGITMLANDDPVSRYSHFADDLNKYINTDKYLPAYNKIIEEFETQIRKTLAIIRKMYATNNASWNHYKMKGKLDSSTFYKRGNYKIFKIKNAPAPIADFVFEFLVDLSGSMEGDKALLAGIALIIFCEALNRLHIPFSVDAFTEANKAITINLKGYNDSYDKKKTNMTLFTEQFNCRQLATWCGNIDELNLQYVSQELLQRKEKDKVLIVISDGATCGSWKDLKQTAENIEKRGVTVLGIGIFDDNVKNIYKNHVILKERKDLEMLGAFLNNYLIGNMFK